MTNEQVNIKDKFGRIHDYLRISLTERCNLRCFYCMPEDGIKLRDKKHFMSSEEVIAIAKVFVSQGVKKIRITGGEPLIKKDIENILTQLGELPIELTLTTNAVLVDKYIDLFKKVGIKSINVSLDSLNEESFNQISRRNYFKRIKHNIDLLIEKGFKVKINAVVIKNKNEHELVDFVKWSVSEPIDVRFIEFMPFDGNNWDLDKTVPYLKMLDKIQQHFGKGNIIKLNDKPNDTTKKYKIANAKGTFGMISTITNPFCDSCNRIRLTADGKVKNCLFSGDEIDILNTFRNNGDIKPLIHQAILNKKEALAGLNRITNESAKQLNNRNMTSIGG